MNKIALFLLMSTMALPAFGEYRVYQYYVRSKTKNISPSNAQIVTSTLNPTSYASYNGGKLSIEVNLLRSWVCMGNTSHKDVCTISEGHELEGVTQ